MAVSKRQPGIRWSGSSQVSGSELCLTSAFYSDLIFQELFVTSLEAPKINCQVFWRGGRASACVSVGCDLLSCQRARCCCARRRAVVSLTPPANWPSTLSPPTSPTSAGSLGKTGPSQNAWSSSKPQNTIKP